MWVRVPRGSNPCKWCKSHEGQAEHWKDINFARHDNCQCAIINTGNGEFLGVVKGRKYLYKNDNELFFNDVNNEFNKIAKLVIKEPKALQHFNKMVALEPSHTNLLKEIELSSKLNLVGLDYRLKTKESYLRKYNNNLLINDIREIKDVNRYTLMGNANNLSNETIDVLNVLRQRGYNISEVKNTWYDGSSYKGINVVVRDKNKNPFELQFHTEESFKLKNGALHTLYEMQRQLPKYSDKWWEIEKNMKEISRLIPNPRNIKEVRKDGKK